jgi:hypothetical protein
LADRWRLNAERLNSKWAGDQKAVTFLDHRPISILNRIGGDINIVNLLPQMSRAVEGCGWKSDAGCVIGYVLCNHLFR